MPRGTKVISRRTQPYTRHPCESLSGKGGAPACAQAGAYHVRKLVAKNEKDHRTAHSIRDCHEKQTVEILAHADVRNRRYTLELRRSSRSREKVYVNGPYVCCLTPVRSKPGNSCRRCHSLDSNHMLNRGYAYTSIISSKYRGRSLLSHLASLYPHSTLQEWQQKLNNGAVTVNGVIATGSESLTSGQTLVWNRPPWIEPDSPQHFELLFDDPHLLAVNKPSGLPTLPGGGFMENTLLRLVQRQTPNANPVHRLGRATSGIVLFAKTPQTASELSASWNTPRIQKIYRALAEGIAQHDTYEILTPIGLVPHPVIGSVWAASPGGKPSKSLAKVISRTTSTTTFEVSLYSGRPHQIRIHLASIGHPLVGDPLYGSTGQPLENLPGLPGEGGYLLHAQFLKFHHPITGEPINIEAAYSRRPLDSMDTPNTSETLRHIAIEATHKIVSAM
jgi:23S rRNA pseudouridine1911/1915/1917 synthase